jgi:hypothetical protein
MDNSEEQFRELLAQVIGRADRMLSERSEVFPMGLLLMPDGKLDVSVAAYESVDQIPGLLNAMRSSLSAKAIENDALASCIAYPDYQKAQVVAFLENRENYCALALIPVVEQPPLHLDVDGIAIGDGRIYVFPTVD